jgi:dinuclear metal center YbgI/SA1388 family protein
MRVSDFVAAMQSIAPLHLAEAWDNVGLLVGDAARALAGPVLLTIDLADAVLDEAIAMKAGAIVAYHPPIFRPITSLTACTPQAAALLRLIENRIALYSPHTALDAAPDGLTDWLIDQACETPPTDRAAITSNAHINARETHKIVTLIPKEALERVRAALAAAGAGIIGRYKLCSFTLDGRGTFRGDAATNPAVGQPGQLEHVDELRLEMVCGQSSLPAAIDALRAAHPYEEPAFDIYTLAPKPTRRSGAGRIVTLSAPTTAESVAHRLKQRLRLTTIFMGTPHRSSSCQSMSAAVNRLSVVPGSGAALLDAAIDAGATCFITGEMKHHEVLHALDRGCAVILAGHTETERGYLPMLAKRINGFNATFDARASAVDAPPLRAV